MEAIQKFRPNVVGFQLATGDRRWYIVGCYLAPEDTLTIESTVAALKELPQGAKLLVARDLNVKLLDPEGDCRGEDTASSLAMEGPEDMLEHFLLRRKSCLRDGRAWSMIQAGREVRSRTDYILGRDRHIFWNVSVRDPRHNSDHSMVMGCFHGALLREHSRYLGGLTAPTRKDRMLTALRRSIPKPQAQDRAQRKMRGSRRPHGDLLRRESPRADILQSISPSF